MNLDRRIVVLERRRDILGEDKEGLRLLQIGLGLVQRKTPEVVDKRQRWKICAKSQNH